MACVGQILQLSCFDQCNRLINRRTIRSTPDVLEDFAYLYVIDQPP